MCNSRVTLATAAQSSPFCCAQPLKMAAWPTSSIIAWPTFDFRFPEVHPPSRGRLSTLDFLNSTLDFVKFTHHVLPTFDFLNSTDRHVFRLSTFDFLNSTHRHVFRLSSFYYPDFYALWPLIVFLSESFYMPYKIYTP